MGGSSSGFSSGMRTGTSGGGGATGGGSGGSGGGGSSGCPAKLKTILLSPASGITAGTWLDLVLDDSPPTPKVLVSNTATGAIVGSLGAVPDLVTLIDCLRNGVRYRAYVDSVTGGRVDITVIRQ